MSLIIDSNMINYISKKHKIYKRNKIYKIPVVGNQYNQSIPENIKNNYKIILRKDIHNPHDSNAIKVIIHYHKDYLIGFIPKDHIKYIEKIHKNLRYIGLMKSENNIIIIAELMNNSISSNNL